MSIEKTQEQLHAHRKNALAKVDKFLDELIASDDKKSKAKADKLCYWFRKYVDALVFEEQFDPERIKRYKRGDIIKVDLGFNIGSEEGGMHYAVVLDSNNSIKSGTITILPLTSVKPHTKINELKRGYLYIGNELYTSLSTKINTQTKDVREQIDKLKALSGQLEDPKIQEKIRTDVESANAIIDLILNEKKEVGKMKIGSIALVGQITTISKIRIIDPKHSNGILSGIRLSTKTLDDLDETIIEFLFRRKDANSKERSGSDSENKA